ncbi:coat protein [Zostera virus T]|uniref:Coat protein n=1 Tax=Zostera virus T TaxID=2562808 RepID=A0A6B7GBU8_9VIRU|nr:coat protein [Zostera virus T]QBS17027.1 coat protein [Zostera virus T]QBS17030.1 coat protein [Zostera virus T]
MGLLLKEKEEMRKEVSNILRKKFGNQLQGLVWTNDLFLHLAQFVFGNIALKGASQMTEFGNYVLESEGCLVAVEAQAGSSQEQAGQTSGDEEPTEGAVATTTRRTRSRVQIPVPREVNVVFRVNFFTLVKSFNMLLSTSENTFVRNKTLRRLCLPFADEAKTYLEIAKGYGEYTTLVTKMPGTCKHAPEVCFDFNEGLDVGRLTDVQTSVMQKIQRRLFHTEKAKRESEARINEGVGEEV